MSSVVIQFRGAAESADTVLSPELQAAFDTPAEALLARGRERGRVAGINYAGCVHPTEAWTLFKRGAAALVDVRTVEECKFVGHVPGVQHVAWMTGTAMTRNPRFVRELQAKVGKEDVVLLLCRSGKRSADAAEAASKGGLSNVFNVLEGFEGDLDELTHRGRLGGWRYWGLPWVQD